jgi:excisionase family DNA binding protein
VSSPEWLSVQQVADLIGVDAKTVARWSRSDVSMPVLRRGRVVRFRADLLNNWLEAQLPRAARARAQRTQSAPDSQLSKSA